jgi:hypothetical protein
MAFEVSVLHRPVAHCRGRRLQLALFQLYACVCVCVCVCVSVCVCVKDMCAYARTYVRPNMLPRERSWEA